MLSGDLAAAATIARAEGRPGLDEVGLELLRPIQPMLASTAPSVADAIAETGRASIEWKLDGIRIQVHRRAGEVSIYTRNLNDITERLADVADVVRSLPGDDLVLDGEALVVDPASGRPVAFQDTASRVSADDQRPQSVQPFFFDIVHLDGRDLADEPLEVRRPLLKQATGQWSIPGTTTDDPATGEAVLASALAAGHEGVVVKAMASAKDGYPHVAALYPQDIAAVQTCRRLHGVNLKVRSECSRDAGNLAAPLGCTRPRNECMCTNNHGGVLDKHGIGSGVESGKLVNFDPKSTQRGDVARVLNPGEFEARCFGGHAQALLQRRADATGPNT